jgi:hypothetical protein
MSEKYGSSYRWTVVNDKTGEVTTYRAAMRVRVTEAHVRASWKVKDWSGGDPLTITPETELKQKYVVSSADIFRFAAEEFGTHWNTCVVMFHANEVLTYKQTDDIDMAECLHQYEGMGAGLTDITIVCNKFISNMIVCDDKAYLILAKFMHANKLESMLVTNN